MVFTFSRSKQVRKVLYKSKKRRCTTVIWHVNRNESNKLNTSNGGNIIGASELLHRNVQNYSIFSTLIT